MSYEVIETREVQDITPAGTPKKAYRVYIVTGKGSSGSIDVSPDDWTTEKLREIFAKKAEELDLAFTIAG